MVISSERARCSSTGRFPRPSGIRAGEKLAASRARQKNMSSIFEFILITALITIGM